MPGKEGSEQAVRLQKPVVNVAFLATISEREGSKEESVGHHLDWGSVATNWRLLVDIFDASFQFIPRYLA